MRVEISVESVGGVRVAARAGAARVELCAGLSDGVLTPSAALIEAAAELAEVHVLVRPRPGDADIAFASVALPASVFLAQGHIGTICTRVEEAREACPAASVYGWARAFTPLLADPLEGPVFLRSSDNPLPDLVASLRGGGVGIRVDLDGRIDSYKGGLRGSFAGIPDAPVSRFVLSLRGGKHGLLQNAANLCAGPQIATARFIGQAGRGVLWRPRVKSRCTAKRKRHGRQRHRQNHGRRYR